MPGSGKSTVGKQLAERLELPFVDLDEEIEKQAGCSINELFSTRGETYFRKLENEALLKVVEGHEKAVIATGGGTPCFFDNLDIIKQNGTSLFINPSLQELMNRMLTDELTKRPKFAGEEPKELLRKLYNERLDYYKQADIHWDGSGAVEELVSIIME